MSKKTKEIDMDFVGLLSIMVKELIPIMAIVFVTISILNYVALSAGKRTQEYLKWFTVGVEKKMANFHIKDHKGEELSDWLEDTLSEIRNDMPKGGIRLKKSEEKKGVDSASIEDFMYYKRDLIFHVQKRVDLLVSDNPPDFKEFANRILHQDPKWNYILRVIPVETLQRFVTILPGLFIIGGIFGTFIGITMALPMIATIDLSHLDEATPILNNFVASIAFSMHTSIIGIIFSVVTTLINTLFPIDSIRSQSKEKLAQTLEYIRTCIDSDNLSTGEKAIVKELVALRKKMQP